MSYLSPPQLFTGTALTFPNPSIVGSATPAVNVQIRNATGWVMSILTLTGAQYIDPYTATTVPIDSGQQTIAVTGTLDAYPQLSNGYVYLQWLLQGESPTEPDGPLTSAATVASTLTNNDELTNGGTVTLSHATTYIPLTIPAGIQSLGVNVFYSGAPVAGGLIQVVSPYDGAGLVYGQGLIDLTTSASQNGMCVVEVLSNASQRLEFIINTSGPLAGQTVDYDVFGYPYPAAQVLAKPYANYQTTAAAFSGGTATILPAMTAPFCYRIYTATIDAYLDVSSVTVENGTLQINSVNALKVMLAGTATEGDDSIEYQNGFLTPGPVIISSSPTNGECDATVTWSYDLVPGTILSSP